MRLLVVTLLTLLLTLEVVVQGAWLCVVEWQAAILHVWGISIRRRLGRVLSSVQR